MQSVSLPKFIEDAAFSGAGEGERNNRAFWLAAQCRDARIDRGAAESLMTIFAQRCSPPLSEREALAALASAFRTQAREPPVSQGGSSRRGRAPRSDDDAVIPWDGVIGAQEAAVARLSAGVGQPDFVVEVPEPSGDPVADLRGWLAALYRPADMVNFVVDSFRDEDGRYKPRGYGINRSRTDIEKDLDKYVGKGYSGEQVLKFVLGDWNAEAGVWARINPMDGKGAGNVNVTRLDHVLVEGDEQAIGQQLAVIRSLELPCAAIVHSGGKSVHAVVRIEAGKDKALYKDRVDTLFQKLEAAGFKPDIKCRNSSRLSRLPGPSRDGKPQYLVDTNCGVDTWEAWLSEQDQSEWQSQTMGVAELSQKPADDSLVGERFLCRQGSWLMVAQSGIGKSVMTLQGAVAFSVGRDLFGLRVKGPLRNLIIQAENNRGDMHETFTGVLGGLKLSKSELKLLENNLKVEHCTRYTGQKFTAFLSHLCRLHKPDIVWIDPLLSYLGGEISKMQDTSRFLRNQLQPVIEDHNCGLVLIHHTGKPPKGDDSKYKGHDLAYLGIGSSDITNWARATSTLLRMDGHDNRFIFEHAKRADRAGCDRSCEIQHASDGSICWLPAPGRSPIRQGKQKEEKLPVNSKYSNLGLEAMPPVSGIWENEERTSSPAVKQVCAMLEEGGLDATLESTATLLKNRRLQNYLVYDRVKKMWKGVLYVEKSDTRFE